MTMLERVRLALQLTVEDYDDELADLIRAAVGDLNLIGIPADGQTDDALVRRAIITYVRCHFGSPSDYDRVKASYDEQKAQLQSSQRYGAAPARGGCLGW